MQPKTSPRLSLLASDCRTLFEFVILRNLDIHGSEQIR